MPSDFHSSPVQSWYISVQHELRHNMMIDVAYVANRADDLVLFANYNQAFPNNAAGTIPLQDRRPNPAMRTSPTPSTAASRATRRCRRSSSGAMAREFTMLSSLTISETKDNGAQSLENSNGNFPAPQDFRNLDADFGLSNYHQPYNSTTSFVWSLPFGTGRRWGSGASPLLDAVIGGWQVAGINSVYAGEPVTFTYTPGATAVVSGIAQDFRGANNYRPNVTCDPMASGDERTIANWFNRSA